MVFHGTERYKTIPEIRYGIIHQDDISQLVYMPGRKEFRPIQPVAHNLRVYPDYYSKFETDIKDTGFRNPPLCWCFNDSTHVIYGTVRAWLAKKLNINLPVFIVDWKGKWKHFELITNKKQALTKFTDEPIELICDPDFFSYYNKRNEYAPSKSKDTK